MRNLPRRVDLSFLSVCTGGLNSHGPKSDHFKNMFALLDLCSENNIFVMTISTISMRQNCSISFSTDREGTIFFSANLLPTRYNYDMWSTHLQRCLAFVAMLGTPRNKHDTWSTHLQRGLNFLLSFPGLLQTVPSLRCIRNPTIRKL